jgi:hypothetical protein
VKKGDHTGLCQSNSRWWINRSFAEFTHKAEPAAVTVRMSRCSAPADGQHSRTNNEPHHVGLSSDGRAMALGCLLSLLRTQDQVFFFDVSDPRNPKFIRGKIHWTHPSPTRSHHSATAAFS